MAMTAWSTTAASNVLANTGINMDEGQSPSSLNDSIREIMAVLKTAIDTGNLTATGTTFNLVNATATTVNFAGAATTVSMGAGAASTLNANFTTAINLNTAAIVSNQTTVAVVNTNATTVNAFGAATTLNIGAATGTLTVANATFAAKAGTFSGDFSAGTGTTTAVGGRISYSGTSAYAGLYANSATPSLTNYALLWNAANSVVRVGCSTGGSVGLAINNVDVFSATGTGMTSPNNLTINDGTATTAGGAAGQGLFFGSAFVSINWGSGAPTITAVRGSLYLRTDNGANTSLYINRDGGTTWAAVTSA